jgi:hypothetical protein
MPESEAIETLGEPFEEAELWKTTIRDRQQEHQEAHWKRTRQRNRTLRQGAKIAVPDAISERQPTGKGV